VAEPRFTISVDELENSAHVERHELVESVESSPEKMPDSRLPQPDRDWFHSGG
jgi:hypothetical protein